MNKKILIRKQFLKFQNIVVCTKYNHYKNPDIIPIAIDAEALKKVQTYIIPMIKYTSIFY